jgi:hypothetical protein
VSSLYAQPFYKSCGFITVVEDAVKYFGQMPVRVKIVEKELI